MDIQTVLVCDLCAVKPRAFRAFLPWHRFVDKKACLIKIEWQFLCVTCVKFCEPHHFPKLIWVPCPETIWRQDGNHGPCGLFKDHDGRCRAS